MEGNDEMTKDETINALEADVVQLRQQLAAANAENGRLQQWVNDLQAGMYINCVYCGHRYGPDDKVPAAMADVLKDHIEQCPKHPMSQLKQRLAAARAEIERLRAGKERPAEFPHIVCLCGSTRFMDAFFEAGWQFMLEGKIVLSVGVCKHAEHHGAEALGPEVADQLDELHLRKIDLADSVFVLNVGGYIGESTAKEIKYAEGKGKPIEYLESCGAAEAAIKKLKDRKGG